MIAVVVLYLVAICTLFAVIWRECDRADAREAELERRQQRWKRRP